MVTEPSFRSEIWKDIRSGIVYLFVRGYFLQWSWKREMSKYFRLAAWSLLSLSTVSLVGEVIVEMAGPTKIVAWLKYVLALTHKIPASAIILVSICSAGYLILHHYREARKPNYEFGFAMGLYECLNGERF